MLIKRLVQTVLRPDLGDQILADAAHFTGDGIDDIAGRDVDQQEIQSQMALLMAESNFIALAFAVGMFCTAVGGFVAARMAYQVPLYHAALVGVLGIMLGAYIGTQWGFWEIAGLFFALPVAILGGYLARAKIGNSK